MDENQFWSKVARGEPDACWEWTGGLKGYGYGAAWFHGKRVSAHRLAYELTHGPIPAGLKICHSCDNPPCCNPAHLFAGTQADNIVDAYQKQRLPSGDKHYKTKVRERDVAWLQECIASGWLTRAEAAEALGVTKGTISSYTRGIGIGPPQPANPAPTTDPAVGAVANESAKLLTVTQAAARLGISRQRVCSLLAAGRLPATRFGQAWMITEEDLAAFVRLPRGRPAKKKAT